MNWFNATQYGTIAAELLGQQRLMPLGPGEPVAEASPKLAKLTPEAVVAPSTVRDGDMASGCLAGLWLYFDHLNESHQISQELHTATGSYWHAIMHRREEDFDNAKYWFRRIGRHPVLNDLATVVSEMDGARDLPTMGRAWDPLMFVDLCAAAKAGRSDLGEVCREIQQREWELLFDYCYRNAI